MRLPRWSAAPEGATPTQKRNFANVQVDAAGVGLASAASPFLPVFLTHLSASNFQVGLLTSMPALTGLLLALAVGRFLQTRRNIVPWYGVGRLLVISAYTLTGLVPWIVPREFAVPAVLAIWALATLPQTVVSVCLSCVMSAVAGPEGRYELMSRRWSILGLTSAVTVALAGQVLDRIDFPLNYQVVFMGLSVGGLISYAFSRQIKLPDNPPEPPEAATSLAERIKDYARIIRHERPFVSFVWKRFIFLSGTSLTAPLFPLYFVRQLQASNAAIGMISTTHTAVMLLGYVVWGRLSRKRGSRFVLLCTTLGLAFYPAVIAFTRQVDLVIVFAGLAGILQAGLDLVFFDELMKRVPADRSPTFVSLAQALQYFSTLVTPLLGTFLADQLGIPGALLVGAAVRLAGFAAFAAFREEVVREPAVVART